MFKEASWYLYSSALGQYFSLFGLLFNFFECRLYITIGRLIAYIIYQSLSYVGAKGKTTQPTKSSWDSAQI